MSHHELITRLASYAVSLAIHQQNESLQHDLQRLEETLTAKVGGPPKSIQQPIRLAMAGYAKKITFDYHRTRFLEQQVVELDVSGRLFVERASLANDQHYNRHMSGLTATITTSTCSG